MIPSAGAAMAARASTVTAVLCLGVIAFGVLCLGGCGDGSIRSGESEGRIVDASGAAVDVDRKGLATMAQTPQVLGVRSARALIQSLERAAGGVDGLRYVTQPRVGGEAILGGTVVGRIGGGEHASRDSIVTPTHDLSACSAFTQRSVPSRADGVGNAVVWLVGVAAGPPDTTARRASLRLAGCRLEPRVQRLAAGATLMVLSHDAMTSRLRFTDVVGDGTPRATVMFNDAGQVVPSSEIAARPGLVQVRDDFHPWVRAYVAVSPHPFVFVTDADGQFRFDGVPPGRYSLVTWSEVLGTRTTDVRVVIGAETRVNLKY